MKPNILNLVLLASEPLLTRVLSSSQLGFRVVKKNSPIIFQE